jgi:hypothetical protein
VGGGNAEAGGRERLRYDRLSRRDFLVLGSSVLGGATLVACGTSTPSASSRPSTASYHSRPDLKPSLIDVTRGSGTPASGYVCVTPAGPLLVDDAGQPVWVQPVPHASTNLRVQNLRGQPVLTWWQGEVASYGVGLSGEYVVMDSSYRQLMTVQAHNGLAADLHEFLITGEGIAYFTAYRRYAADLRSVGGPKSGTALDATIQGVDLSTGSLVFDWHSADHIEFTESHEAFSKSAPYDPVHVNSIDTTSDGKLLVSARNTWTVYKIDPATGDIIWRLGGKKSDFTLGPDVRFAWQHDARFHLDGTMSLFDDEGDPPEAKQSRGLVLNVDETTMTATVARQYDHPRNATLAGSQGSVQILPGGHVMVGWGAEPYYTEFEQDGTMVLDAKFAKGTSYRAFRFDWTGTPTDRPAVAAGRTKAGHPAIYASWNGSTETASWRLLAGPTAGPLQPAGRVPRNGFETTIPLEGKAVWVAVQALDGVGTVLGQSPPIRS